jgi:hypothetical protein
MRLEPDDHTYVCGRNGFLIHGDNASGVASSGCIVVPLLVRQRIAQSLDNALTVVAEESDC